MPEVTNEELIEKAKSVIAPRRVDDYVMGNVGCALITAQGNFYYGVCIDVSSGMGFCAEHGAIGAMVTAGEYRIKKIVAVCGDERGTFVLSPCGCCREFMRQIHQDNLETEVILDYDKVLTVAELLPFYDWRNEVA